jgi:hypothetical protein
MLSSAYAFRQEKVNKSAGVVHGVARLFELTAD